MLTHVRVREEAITNFQLQCHDMNAIITRNIGLLAYYSSQRAVYKRK
jgi:hypothetical protein